MNRNRNSLQAQTSRQNAKNKCGINPSSYTNFRFMTTPEKNSRLQTMSHQNKISAN